MFISDLNRIRDAGHRLLALIDDIANFRGRNFNAPPPPSPKWAAANALADELVKPRPAAATASGGHLLSVDDSKVTRDLLARRCLHLPLLYGLVQ